MKKIATYYKLFLVLFLLVFGSFSQISIGTNETLDQSKEILYQSDDTFEENQVSIDERNYYAIIVGIDEFDNNSNFNNTDTALSFYDQLIKGHNWIEENVKLLINEDATKSIIKSSIINWLNYLENEDDVVLFYFCGETEKLSFQQRSIGNTYSIPFDVSDYSYAEDKITDKEFDSWFDTLDSFHISIILDTSYASYMSSLKQYGRTILTATGSFFPKKETSINYNGKSILTHFLIKGLDGYADEDNNGIIDIDELFSFSKISSYDFSIQQMKFNILNPSIHPQIPKIYNRHFNTLDLYTLPFGWKQLTDNGFGKQSNYGTRGMEIFNGDLYIGTQNNMMSFFQNQNLEYNSFIAASAFPDFYALFGDLTHLPIRFGLHLMTFVSQGCEIWKYNYSTDSLSMVVGKNSDSGMKAGFGSHFNAAASVMKEFQGYLYIGTWNTPIGSLINPDRKGCELWRSADGLHWEQVVGHIAPFAPGGFGNPDNTGAWSIEIFNDYLYVGTMNWDFSDEGGCEVWRSSDGLHWEQVVDYGFREFMSDEELEKEAINTYAWAMEEYNNELYMGTFNSRLWRNNEKGTGCQLWKTMDGVNWQKVALPNGLNGASKDGFGEAENYGIRSLVTYNDDLYVGTGTSFFHDHGCEIWRYDGTYWYPIISDEVAEVKETDVNYDGFGNPMNKYIWSMTVTKDNTLWVGTGNGQVYLPFVYDGENDHRFIDAETHGFEIWSFNGEEWSPVIKNDIGLKPNGIGDASNLGARSMIEYPKNSGNIVIGTFKLFNPSPGKSMEGCELWLRYIL